MPKSKKRKTNHHKATGPNGELTHEEIWDDSALIRSWNEAVEEYEFYHSIHAKGEDLDEILRQAEAEENEEALLQDPGFSSSTAHELISESILDDDKVEDAEFYTDVTAKQPEVVLASQDVLQSRENTSAVQLTPNTEAALSNHPSIQQSKEQQDPSILSPLPSTDQTLENIKMAYYWAGYYSGLHDGQLQQQQQQQSSQQSQQNNNTHPEPSQQPT